MVTIGAGQPAAARSMPRRAASSCSGEAGKIAERYWVPTSLPWRLSWVGSWVAKMDVEDVVIGDLVRIEGHPDRLGMAGVAAADLAIGRVVDMAADIAALDRADADQILEHRLGAPEASARQNRLFLSHSVSFRAALQIGCLAPRLKRRLAFAPRRAAG